MIYRTGCVASYDFHYLAWVIPSDGGEVGCGTGRASALRESPRRCRGEDLGCESGRGVANVADRDRTDEGAGDEEVDSG